MPACCKCNKPNVQAQPTRYCKWYCKCPVYQASRCTPVRVHSPYVAPVSIFSRGLIPESAHVGYDFSRSEATAAGWSNDVQRRLGVDEAATHACQRVADSFIRASDVRTCRKSSVVIVVARLRVNTAASVSVYIRTCTVPLSLHARMRQLNMVRKRLYEARNAILFCIFRWKKCRRPDAYKLVHVPGTCFRSLYTIMCALP